MHILTGMVIALMGVALLITSGRLADFQYRTLQAFNIVDKSNPNHVRILKYWSILFGIICIVLGIFIVFRGYFGT